MKEFYKLGITYISDIFTEDGQIKGWDHFRMKGINRISFLKWQGLISALPLKWRTHESPYVRPENTFQFHCKGMAIALFKSEVKQFRKLISSFYFKRPISQIFFRNLFEGDLDWLFTYTMPFKVTTSSVEREFQWKLTHNILFTNSMLFRFHSPLVSTDTCTFCKNVPETLIHLFVECTHIKSLWLDMHSKWSGALDLPRHPSPKQIILGDKSWTDLLNHIIIIYKRFIYNCKLKGELPNFNLLKIEIAFNQHLEQFIARKNDTINKYLEKWKDFIA